MIRRYVFTALFALAACTTAANPPSLLPRPVETQSTAAPARPASSPRPLDATIAAKLAALVVEAQAGDRDFDKADRAAGPAIIAGRGATPGSEGWVTAQLVQSALQVARQRSAAALSEIDQLAVAQGELAAGDANVGGRAELQTAQSEVEAIVARQTARLAALSR